jgi:hypothetical protein
MDFREFPFHALGWIRARSCVAFIPDSSRSLHCPSRRFKEAAEEQRDDKPPVS